MYLCSGFLVSEEKLLLGNVFFALVGLNKDCLSHAVSSDGLRPRTGLGPSLLFWAGPHRCLGLMINNYYQKRTPCKRVSYMLEICPSRERRVLQDQIQLGIELRVQL